MNELDDIARPDVAELAEAFDPSVQLVGNEVGAAPLADWIAGSAIGRPKRGQLSHQQGVDRL